MPGFLFLGPGPDNPVASDSRNRETFCMRIVYLTFAAFVLLGIGATCRTTAEVPAGCERLGNNLVHCPKTPSDG